MTISKAQILSVLSAVIFVPAGAFVSAWSAKNLPGLPTFSATEITGVMVAGAGSAFGIALHYLKGLREWEKLEAEGIIKVKTVPPAATQTHIQPPAAPPVA